MSEILERALHSLPYVLVGWFIGKGLATWWIRRCERKHG